MQVNYGNGEVKELKSFEIIKENLPKINCTAQRTIEKEIKKLIDLSHRFWGIGGLATCSNVSIESLDDENITVLATILYAGVSWENKRSTFPIKLITDEDEFVKKYSEYVEEHKNLFV